MKRPDELRGVWRDLFEQFIEDNEGLEGWHPKYVVYDHEYTDDHDNRHTFRAISFRRGGGVGMFIDHGLVSTSWWLFEDETPGQIYDFMQGRYEDELTRDRDARERRMRR